MFHKTFDAGLAKNYIYIWALKYAQYFQIGTIHLAHRISIINNYKVIYETHQIAFFAPFHDLGKRIIFPDCQWKTIECDLPQKFAPYDDNGIRTISL
jgi:hypothetical protein